MQGLWQPPQSPWRIWEPSAVQCEEDSGFTQNRVLLCGCGESPTEDGGRVVEAQAVGLEPGGKGMCVRGQLERSRCGVVAREGASEVRFFSAVAQVLLAEVDHEVRT